MSQYPSDEDGRPLRFGAVAVWWENSQPGEFGRFTASCRGERRSALQLEAERLRSRDEGEQR